MSEKMMFTKNQNIAINHDNSDLVVSASAGAGKTAVLIEYIFKKIALEKNNEKTYIDEILAMTFTDAAANSMKKRLFQRMNQKLSEEEIKEGYDEKHLKAQAKLLPSADICTIDAFCTNILNQYCYILGWDPNRPKTVLDNNTIAKLKADAAHEVVLNNILNDKEIYDFISSYSDNGNHTIKFENILVGIGNNLDKFDDDKSWINKVKEYYSNKDFDKLDENNKHIFYFSIEKHLQNIINTLNDYLDVLNIQRCDFAKEKIDLLLNNYNDVINKIRKSDKSVFELFSSLELITAAKIFDLKNKDFAKEEVYQLRDQYSIYYKKIKKSYDKLEEYKLLYESFTLQNTLLEPRIDILLKLIEEYRVLVDKKKEELNGIDFVDMEKAAIKILENKDIAERLRKKYKYILVDEYQDSNDIQEKLVQLICRKNPGNVFRVGDIKQSIYGFRSAKPELMRNIINNAAKDEKVVFEDNFRSSQIIVEFNNCLYKTIMNIPGYSDTYTDENDVAKAGSYNQTISKEKVELHLLDMLDENDQIKKIGDARFDESYYVANKIIEMRNNSLKKEEEIRNKWNSFNIKEKESFIKDNNLQINNELINSKWDELPNNIRQKYNHNNGIFSNWKDYVVLVRNHDFKRILEYAFDALKVPKFFITNKGYYDDVAVQSVLSWLKWLANKDDEIAMFAVLTSPYYEWNNEKMADFVLAINSNTNRCDYLFDIHKNIKEDYCLLKKNYETKGLISLIESIINLNNFYYTKTTIEQRDNLSLFFEKCVSVYNQYSDLDSLLRWVEINEKSDEGSATSISSSADVVRMITIHNSKGLEYPVVFYLGDTLKRRRGGDFECRVDEKLGLALNVYQKPYQISFPNLLYKNIENKKYQEDIEEEIRLMYVASTRAMSKLVIISFEDKQEKVKFDSSKIESIASSACAIGNMIRDCIKLNKKEMENLCEVYHIRNRDISTKEIIKDIKDSDPYEIKKYIKDNISIKEVSPSSLEEKRMYTISYENEYDGALRGTLIHKAFESLDFLNPRIEDIKVPLSELDKKMIMNFFNHDLAKTIKDMNIYHELPYAFIDDNYYHGYMDLVAIDDSQIILIDYKSDLNKTEEEYIKEYSSQQNAYRKALKQLNLPIRCFLYSLQLDKFIEIKDN